MRKLEIEIQIARLRLEIRELEAKLLTTFDPIQEEQQLRAELTTLNQQLLVK